MRKVCLSLAIAIVMGSFCLSLTTLPENVQGVTLYVGGPGPGNYTTIQSAIDNATPGYTIFVYEGIYNENLIVNKTVTLIGENELLTIIDGGGSGDAVNVTADWTNISGFLIRNSGPVLLEDAGVDARNVAQCNISGNIFQDNPRIAIFFWFANSTKVSGNTFLNNNGAIVLLQSYWNVLDNNDVTGNPIGITYFSENNTVSNSTITSSSSGIFLGDANNNVIIDNTLADNTEGINSITSSRNKLVNNTITSSTVGILMDGGHNNTVAYNTISDSWTGIQLGYSRDTIFRGNNVSLSSWEGLRVRGSDGTVISDNSFSYNFRGLYLFESRYSILANNEMLDDGILLGGASLEHWNTHSIDTSNTLNSKPIHYWKNSTGGTIPLGAGHVILANCSGVTVDGQSISHSYYGIQLGFSSSNSVIKNNVSNSAGGIYLQFSENNTIASNTLFSNDNGVALVSGNNRVYHNSFISNTVHAFDTDGTSQWDDGYPSGGNYWDDYSGVDLNSGPNQDIPGSDRIGDSSYPIQGSGSNEDRYPLMFFPGISGRPNNLSASLSGMNHGDVALSWNLSPNDGSAGNYVVRYELFRSTGVYDPNGTGYQLIASIPNGTSSFIDSGKGEGDPENYFYVVCAVDSWNDTACSNGQAGKFTYTLSKGPNLVSIPLSQSDETIEVVLQTLSFDKSWFYDSFNKQWKSYVRSKPHIGEFRHVNHTMGLWVNVIASSNLTVAGVVPSNTSIQLTRGWNLVAFPSFNSSYTVAHLKLDTGALRVEGFDSSGNPYHTRLLSDVDILVPGFGYWILTDTATTWVVRPS